MYCRKMPHTPEPKSSPSAAAAAAPAPQTVRGYGGPGLVGVRVDVARMWAAPPPHLASPTHSASSAVVSSPPSLESPETVQRERRRAEGQERKGEAVAGTGEGGNKGRQTVASGQGVEVAAAGAGGKGEQRGEHAAARPRADPFNLAESGRLGGLVVADILVVSEEEGEEARRMALAGGPEAADCTKCAGSCHEVVPLRAAEEGGGQR